jgi:hypothetical protein
LNFLKNPPLQFAVALLFVVKNLPKKTCASRLPSPFVRHQTALQTYVKCTVPAFFGEWFEGKDGSLRAYKPSSQELAIKKDFCSGLGL